MAAKMFYSLQEAAKRLGKTQDEVKRLARDGKLREFKDGAHLLFKIDEVEALLAETTAAAAPEPALEAEENLDLEPVADLGLEPAEDLGLEPVAEAEEGAAPEEPLELDELAEPEEPTLEPETDLDLELGEGVGAGEADTTAPLDFSAEPELEETTGPALEEESAGEGSSEEEISLAETGAAAGSDITDLDTALTGEGVSVLGETDKDYPVTDDTLAETLGPPGASTEASLEEIEGDVNLDSFGSGSGLLDLSLQADDTSLGGILDEIYTAEGGEEAAGPAGKRAAGRAAETPAAEDMAAEAAEMAPAEEGVGMSEMTPQIAAIARPFVEAAPDFQSNTLGILLVLPLVVSLYTAIVTFAARMGVVPSVLTAVQGFIWYLVGAAAVVTGLVVAAAFLVGREGSGAQAAPKEKTRKAPKEKKQKPTKEEILAQKKAAQEQKANAKKGQKGKPAKGR